MNREPCENKAGQHISPPGEVATKTKLRLEHALLDPFELKKNIERKLKNFFTVLGNLKREATNSGRPHPKVTFSREATRHLQSRSMWGRSCIRGMRIWVKDVLEMLAAGVSEKKMLEDFSYLLRLAQYGDGARA